MKLLFITQKIDRNDWLLGFTHSWLKTLATRVEGLVVICLERGETDLPKNVKIISLGKEQGAGRLKRLFKFWQAIATTIGEVDGVFAHMSPVFALAAAPFTKLFQRPLVLWYTHRSVSHTLRWAVRVSDAVVTASPESFQLATPKVQVVGHGIDPVQFFPTPLPTTTPPLILAVGRLSPIKRYELLIEAIKHLQAQGLAVRCVIAGDDPSPSSVYGNTLKEKGSGVVEFIGAVPYHQIAAWYHRAAVTVNLCPTGGLDKAVLEGLLCGRPVLLTNQSFAPLLGPEGQPWLVAESSEAVAEGLANLLADPDRQAKIDRIQARTKTEAGVERLMERLLGLFHSLIT